MFDAERIGQLIGEVEALEASVQSNIISDTKKVLDASRQVHQSWSGSALGHHGSLYYEGFKKPPSGHSFNSEWGTVRGMPIGWSHRSAEEVTEEVMRLSGVNLDTWQNGWDAALEHFKILRDSLLTEFSALGEDDKAEFQSLLSAIQKPPFDDTTRKKIIAAVLNAHRSRMSRDSRAISASYAVTPSQVFYEALAEEIFATLKEAANLRDTTKRLLRGLELAEQARMRPPIQPGEVMGFREMSNNPFVLVKKNGQTISFKGLLTKERLFTFDSRLPVDDNDIVERTLPGDRLERYIVTDTGFCSGTGTGTGTGRIEDHYQMKVRKENAATTQGAAHLITNIYNVQGPNARVNLQTVDNSHNVANIGEAELFQKMRAAIEAGVSNILQRQQLLARVSILEETSGTPAFADNFQQLLAVAANCMTILTPFLPALGQLAASAF